MKINRLNGTDYKIYYYKNMISENDIKDLIKKIQKRLKLKGYYKVIVINKSIGMFLELKHLDESFYKNTLELKIEIKDSPVYFKTKDYFIIKKLNPIRYFDGMYYCVVDESFDEILEKVEFGDFIFEIDMNEIIDRTIVI